MKGMAFYQSQNIHTYRSFKLTANRPLFFYLRKQIIGFNGNNKNSVGNFHMTRDIYQRQIILIVIFNQDRYETQIYENSKK